MVFHAKILSVATFNTFIQLLIIKSDRFAIANSEFNPSDVCHAIDRSAQFHSLCLRSSVVKQKGFIPKHLRPPWLDSSLFEDNKLKAEEKEPDNGCYACYKGTKASNGTNEDEDYCACVYKNQAPNEQFSKIIGTFDGLNCLQDLYKMAFMPKCGNPYYDQIKHCAMVHFYENEPEKEPNGHEYKRTLALLDGCVATATEKNCTAKVKIEFEQAKSSFFYGNCDAQKKTVFESSFEIMNSSVSPFTLPVVFQHRICSSLFGSAQMENAFNGITVTISGDCGTNSFQLPAIEFDKGRVHEMRGLQLAMVGQAVQWRDPRGAHLYTEQRQLTWQPTELKSISANGKVNIALQYPETDPPEFSMNLLNFIYRNCCADSSSAHNTVLSSVSAAIALAMAYAGARGQTAAEFVNLLADGDGSSIHQNNAKFIEEIESEKTFNLSIANKIYLDKRFTILEEFNQTLSNYYQGNFESIDFGNSEEAAKKVNAFIEDATNHKITNMITPAFLQGAILLLVNAIYFAGQWSNPFNERGTQKETFFLANGKEIKLEMMRQTNKFVYLEETTFKLLGMEFVGGNAHLFIVLPNSKDGLTKVLGELTEAKLIRMVKKSPVIRVEVFLPKFKIESTHELEQLLPSLGLKSAFDPNSADFSGISHGSLCIDKVLQKAMISVDEKGCEAAAATVVKFKPGATMGQTRPPPPPVFRADHPFAFFLVKSAKEVMFSGAFVGKE
ncbi:hypothetical protein niasHS_001916 [Heterodera schachtii]|uniref:Serpin domain-containing protein n=1 Tax=Heterodera schachtii TaxID=97005 RepID=A0ABD2KAN5_HETSC